jgi:hypothetical protein
MRSSVATGRLPRTAWWAASRPANTSPGRAHRPDRPADRLHPGRRLASGPSVAPGRPRAGNSRQRVRRSLHRQLSCSSGSPRSAPPAPPPKPNSGSTHHPRRLTPEQVRRLLEQAGGLIGALTHSDPALRAQLYEELGINGVYDPGSHTVHVQVEFGRRIGRVGGADATIRPTDPQSVVCCVEDIEV